MDGMHDLGGKQGFGAVRYTLDAPAFQAAWALRANSLYVFAVRQGIFNMDEYRPPSSAWRRRSSNGSIGRRRSCGPG
jgi:hypothetical protein